MTKPLAPMPPSNLPTRAAAVRRPGPVRAGGCGPRWPSLVACVALLALALLPMVAQAKRVALLIGNQAYTHERPLRNPVADAELLARVLRDDLKFDTVQVERNLNLARMDAVVERFAEQAKGATAVVFYFSGHGLTSAGDRRSFLLPVDARTGTPDSLPLRRQAVAADEVRDALRAAGAQVTLMLLDACRDGPGDGKSGSKGLARVGGGDQFLVAYATEEGQIAADGSGRNSPYAQALAQAWRQPLPILAQLDKVYDLVTAQVPGQRPTREGNLRADARLSPFAPVSREDERRIENEAWELAKRLNTVASYRAYLDAYPQGQYVAAARVALAALQPSPQPAQPPQRVALSPGQTVQDCADCPALVVLGAGSFVMGSPAREAGREADEGPQRTVTIAKAFALGRTEVTVAQWRRFVMASGYVTEAERNVDVQGCWAWDDADGKGEWRAGRSWRDPGFAQRDDHPVVCVSWNDAQAYVRWLSGLAGQQYRLPTEAEWEYAARAGGTTSRHWGDDANQACRWANGADQSRSPSGRTWTSRHECNDGHWFTAPVRSYGPNGYGLHDMLGNVSEWVQDCYDDTAYGGKAPSDGAVYQTPRCELRVLRGGSWFDVPQGLRSAYRDRGSPGYRVSDTGFRLARTVF